ncbi:MAG TPA: squalene/phytoene synthase family protein [Alphaproteobacteria bacterium]|nr:squalene/phytoene synthase family protein [Alphaproteobacteria bacterium]
MNAASVRHASQYLRDHDRDRYFATLVLKPGTRHAVQALYAFNADVASIRDRAREPAAGEIRLQWWTDALNGKEHGAVRANPLADALLGAIDDYRLPTGALVRLVAARRFDLYDDPMPDLPSFEGYAGETASVLYQLAAMILNEGRAVETGDAAGHLGVAHALVGHLRAFGLNASRGRLFLPFSVFAANGVTEGEIFTGTVSEGLLAAHHQLTELAREHLDKAAAAIARLPRPLRPAFAATRLLAAQLRKVEQQGGEPFAPPREIADWRKIGLLSLWAWRNG